MLESFVRRQIERKVLPGISILAACGDGIHYERCFGQRAVWPDPEPLDAATLFDLASLTKPLVIAFLAARIIEAGEWRLEDEARRFLPELAGPAFTLRQLLTHTAGLKAWHPFYLYRPRHDLEQAAALPPAAAPGTRVIYSDVGYILLRHLLERTTGAAIGDLAARLIFAPLGLDDVFLGPPPGRKERCAPTEVGNRYEKGMCRGEHDAAAAAFAWRCGLIRGEVHDANSHYAGGCAGNAGLFASARALFRLGREFFPSSATLLKRETVALFWRDLTPGLGAGRSLGFQLNTPPAASAGRALAPGAIGHTGFTGTSLWLEAEGERQWILLSNRVHPRVKKEDFNIVRRKMHGLLKRELHLA